MKSLLGYLVRLLRGPEARVDADEGVLARAQSRFHSVVGALLLFAIVLMANYLAFRHYERWDWTTESRYTLSERTDQVLADLERDVEIILLLSEGEEEFTDVRELIQRYSAATTRVRLREIDPDRQPSEARRIAQRYDVRLQADGEGATLSEVAALVTSGDRHWKITRDDMIHVGMGAGEGPQVDVQAERAITGAIVELIEGRTTQVCVTNGHGEWTVGGGERSLSFLRDELERENTELVPLESLSSIPSNCDAVFVLGPQRSFRPEEAERLVRYAADGGKLLLALDPIPTREEVRPTGFENALAEVGIRLDASILIETNPQRLLTPDPTDRVLLMPQPHATTMPALSRGGPFVVSLARTVRGEGDDVTPLLEGSEESFGKVELASLLMDADVQPGPGDIEGPVSVAVARTFGSEGAGEEGASEGSGRLMVFGDSDWMQDSILAEPSFANIDVLMATVGWLTERDSLVAVPPRRSNLRAVVMSEADMSSVWRRVMIFLPGAAFLLGFAVWWSRRQ